MLIPLLEVMIEIINDVIYLNTVKGFRDQGSAARGRESVVRGQG